MHSHGIHNDCEKILKKWMHFDGGLKNNWQELETVLCAYGITFNFFSHASFIMQLHGDFVQLDLEYLGLCQYQDQAMGEPQFCKINNDKI